MKKSTKITLISLAALAILAGIGGNLIAVRVISSRYQAFGKAKLAQDIKEAEKKQREEEKTTKAKQLAYLKEHEQEIVDFVKSEYPTIESVQIDWSTMTVDQAGNGTPQGGDYYLSISGTFNHIDDTFIVLDFYLDSEESLPDIKNIGMLNPPHILRGDVWEIYE
ncbi:lipoprotein [Streptococcus criceti]|uniref:Uncharacterized protein n=1 Tax=Streptococcus criceti HS-6 TaxID=873449 RepID=G5JN58_STRCG|nr:hypothetical protein [Streptococcus criceti]EHI73518.1 hypothetical protein STRCR_1393 [Streptococcus criceti HS-6]SUN43365.1 lipoprotein [Streptococcus criceti]